MHKTKHSHMLRAIGTLTTSSKLSAIDLHDIRLWINLSGKNYETAQLSEKSLERIATIYQRFFTEV